LDLPLSGAFPPHDPVYPNLVNCHLAVPPVCPEVFEYDWLELLLELHSPDSLRLPEEDDLSRLDVFRGKITELYVGATVLMGDVSCMGYLQKLGFITTQTCYKYVQFSDISWARYTDHIRGGPRASTVRGLQYCTIERALPPYWGEVIESDVLYVDYDSDSSE
jgi:hypothetical protein